MAEGVGFRVPSFFSVVVFVLLVLHDLQKMYIFIHILLYTCTIIQVIRYLILKSKGMDTVNPNEGFLKINRILSNRCVRRVFQVLNKHAPIENTDSFDRPGVIIIVDVLVFSR